ncbi:hypothetical protein DPMN_117427 [Dreissena polymorpha]|uniref:B box-type domain-containing protein n=1 Tax=Dreissena polymorpha TaxID=45954 RepID=A0A9D4KPV9_DREPO|nr:hypothetical protein DPMN_117427 [Dreissena polymorpha]
MASNIGYSVHRGSDVFFDFPCGTCQGNDKNIEAEFYCDQCTTFLCGKCMKHHKRLFQKHATLGKESISKWPVSNATSDVLDRCRIHIDRTLETFCEDHNELLCTVCHIYNHQ